MAVVHEADIADPPAKSLKRQGRGSPDERRTQLIDATIRCIAEQGLSNITLNSVAKSAGLTAGLINFHFDSKQKLLSSTLEFVAAEFEEACREVMDEPGLSASDKLAGLVRVCFDEPICTAGKVAVWYSFWGEAPSRHDYVAICARSEAFLQHSLQSLIEELAGHGDVRLNTMAAAKGLCGLIEVLWQELLSDQGGFDRDVSTQTCLDYLENILPGRFERPKPAVEITRDTGELAPTLPGWAYCDADNFHREMQQIHLPAWQIVCHQSDIPEPGDYFSFEGLGKRAFVVRQEDGNIAAFHNVCPHRAHALVKGSGSCAGLIRCPYHSWGFDFAGNLRAIAAKKAFPPFDSGDFGLKPVDCETFLGFVYIRFASGGRSIADRFAPHLEELSHYRFEDMKPIAGPTEEVVDADWKNVWDNYLEDYHFPTGHPGLFSLMGMQYDRQPDEETRMIRLSHDMRENPKGWSNELYARHLPKQPNLPEDLQRRWSYFFCYPSFAFDVYPDMMDFFHIVPLAPGRSQLRYAAYGLPSADDRTMDVVRRLNMRINHKVGREDNELIESVQKGLESGSYDVGLLGEKEHAVRAFQSWVCADLGDNL